MNIREIVGIIAALLLISFTTTSCHKKNTEFDYNQAVATTHDYVEAQQMTNLLLATYFKAITDSTLFTDSISIIDGAEVTLTSSPTKIEFNYFNGIVFDGYGHIRIGNYNATTTTAFHDPLAEITFDFPSFSYDGDEVTAEEFVLKNTENIHIFDVVAENITRTYRDTSGTIVYNYQQNITLIKDPSSPYYTDYDYFDISGNLTGKARNGSTFNASISEESTILLYYSCNWMKAGNVYVELPEFIHNAAVSYFNNESCINKYSITTNDILFEKGYDYWEYILR